MSNTTNQVIELRNKYFNDIYSLHTDAGLTDEGLNEDSQYIWAGPDGAHERYLALLQTYHEDPKNKEKIDAYMPF